MKPKFTAFKLFSIKISNLATANKISLNDLSEMIIFIRFFL